MAYGIVGLTFLIVYGNWKQGKLNQKEKIFWICTSLLFILSELNFFGEYIFIPLGMIVFGRLFCGKFRSSASFLGWLFWIYVFFFSIKLCMK